MKIILAIIAVVIIGVLILGFLFVRWANNPEQIEYFKKQKEIEAAKKLEDEKNKAVLEKEIEAKRANLKLVIDENFAGNKFEFLDYKYAYSFFNLEKNEFHYAGTIYSGQNPQQFFIYSKEDFGDFAAEINFDIWGSDTKAGIFWDAQPNGEQNPKEFQAAYATPNGLYVEAEKSDDFDLGSFFESVTTQRMRIERFGNRLRVSVNDKLFYDEPDEKAGQGKVGIYVGHRGGLRKKTESLIVDVKSFKVWK